MLSQRVHNLLFRNLRSPYLSEVEGRVGRNQDPESQYPKSLESYHDDHSFALPGPDSTESSLQFLSVHTSLAGPLFLSKPMGYGFGKDQLECFERVLFAIMLEAEAILRLIREAV